MIDEAQKKSPNKFISHVFIHDQRIIPFDTFDIGDNEYSLLKIVHSTDEHIFLKLIIINGPNMGNIYLVPKFIFETKNIDELEKELYNYKQ